MFSKTMNIADYDPALWKAMEDEVQRQEDHIELIASENYTSPRVLQAQGSQLTNKYAEGYPGKRYYGGCQFVDVAESLAIERLKKLYGVEYANVQPHSGSQANAQAYMALINAGDTIMGMDLAAGGHLTHGSPVNFSGILYKTCSYGVDPETGLIDYDEMEKIAHKHKPQLLIGGFSAYSRVVDWERMANIAKDVGAYFLCDIAHVSGLIAAGVYPSPVDYADVITSTTHKTLRGPRSGIIMAKSPSPELQKRLQMAVFPGNQGGPLMHVIAGKAVAFQEALEPEFKTYQEQVIKNAKAMAQKMMERGIKVCSGGTDNHLLLLDLSDKGITGKEAELLLDEAHITVNKNMIPGDKASPFVTSGIRIGTPAATTRGFKEKDCMQLADWMADLLLAPKDPQVMEDVKKKVAVLCNAHPVYRK